MKILYLSTSFYPFIGGISRFSTELCKALAADHEITVLTENHGGILFEKNIKIKKYSGYRWLWRPLSIFLRNFFAFYLTYKEVKTGNYDFVLVSSWTIFGTFMAFLNTPFVLFFHGTELLMPIKKNGLSAKILRWVGSKATCFASNSAYTKSIVDSYWLTKKRNSFVVGCGVNPDDWDYYGNNAQESELILDLLKERRFLISVGRLLERKGFDSTIKAFSTSLYSADGKLVIVGSGPKRKELDLIAKKENIAEKIIFLEEGIDDSILSILYKKSDIFILLNKEINGDYEGFGIVFLEASLHGIPVIGVNNGGVPDAIDDLKSGYLVSPNNTIYEASNYIDMLFNDQELRLAMGNYGRQRVLKDYTWSNVAVRLVKNIENYKNLISENVIKMENN